MKRFRYRARDIAGTDVIGELEAFDGTAAQFHLQEQGLFPVSIEEHVPKNKTRWRFKFRRRFGSKELASFTRQFEVMFGVGMPIDNILTTLGSQAENPGLKQALAQIHDDISGGARLSEAFAKHPKYFNKLYVSMIEMGQTAGMLDKTLHELSTILEKEHDIQFRISSATLYPKIVLFTVLIVTWAMLVFVFPPFKAFYSNNNTELPLPTRIVMAISDLLVAHWYIPLLTVIITYILWRQIKKLATVQQWLGAMAMSVPVFGDLNLLAANAQFGHLVAAMYRVGLPLPQTLSIVANTIPNICYRDEVLVLKEKIELGFSLNKAMEPLKYFSPMIKQTCAVGEQTGKLDKTLDATAGFYDIEIREKLANLSTLIEPFMLFGLFGVVMLLALAVYLPIWNMSKVILH